MNTPRKWCHVLGCIFLHIVKYNTIFFKHPHLYEHCFYILYINSVSLSVCLSVRPSVEVLKPRSVLIKLSPRIRGPKNYSGLRVLTSYFYFYVRFRAATTGGPYFLLLLLRPFPRNNCRRRWGRYFWDFEGG
jgi:hypothetical protein